MSSSKRQSIIMIGVGLILLSVLIIYFALSQPRVSDEMYIEGNSVVSEAVTDSTSSTQNEQVQQSNTAQYKTEEAKTSEYQSKSTQNGKININTCTADELTAIDGIGDTRADAIIQYREYLGGYTSVEQIKNIKGVGDKLYAKIAPYLTV